MNRLKMTVELVRKYRRTPWIVVDLLWIVALILAGVMLSDWSLAVFCIPFCILIMWECSDVHLYAERDRFRDKVKSLDDELLYRYLTIEEQGKEIARLKDELAATKLLVRNHKDNPIKSNRVVNDKTFAVRFKSFVEEVEAKDPMSEEEKEYLHHVAERLLKWQTKTVRKDTEEYKYLERLGLMPEPSQNTEEHPMPEAKKRPVSKKKKTKTNENENKN